MRTLLRRHPAGLHLGLMLALTFSTGIVDSVGYLGLDRVFTGNMTGNVVILGMALTGANGLPIVGPILALIGFMLGALVAGRSLRTLDAGWSHRSTVLFGAVGVLLASGAILMLTVPAPRPQALTLAVTAMLGLAMGTQAGAARHIGVKDVTTVVVTSTIVGLAFDSRFGGNASQQWKRRGGAILLIGAGAAFGAIVLRAHIGWGMAAAALLSVVVTVLGHLGRPHPVLADSRP